MNNRDILVISAISKTLSSVIPNSGVDNDTISCLTVSMQNLKDLNWNHLYYFHEMARNQSMKKTAQFLGLAPSTLSEQLKKLENTVGHRLFVRRSRSMTLTAEGEELFEHTKNIFAEGFKLLEKFSQKQLGGYPVNVGIEETISSDLAVEFTSQYWDFFAPYGTVNTMRIVGHEFLLDSLSNDHCDWGISITRPKRKGLSFEEIGGFKVKFCCSSELFEMFKNPKDLLINIPFAETSQDESMNRTIRKHLRKNKIIPKETISSDHPSYTRNLCERGRCVMFVPENPLDQYEGLKIFDIGEPLEIKLYAIWKRSDEGLVSIKKLRQLINSKLSQLPERYEDVELQIEVSDVSDELLT